MALKKYNPTSPGRRFMSVPTYEEITKTVPEKSLVEPLKKKAGRNSYGRITVRHRGGGNKRQYRIIDFKRNRDGIPAKVVAIEYDPNRSANIALIQYEDGVKSYILAPVGLTVGQEILSGETADIKPGNTLMLKDIPVGTIIHNIELYPGHGGQLVLSLIHISITKCTTTSGFRTMSSSAQQLCRNATSPTASCRIRRLTSSTRRVRR